MKNKQNYSVLMSVYKKEKAEYLKTSMESIATQSVATNDFVLVCDGPLTQELDQVIENMQKVFGEILRVHRLEKNEGLGKALNYGMKQCKNELIARMDSDDISFSDRMERQLRVFERNEETDLCSGTVEEFSTEPEQVSARRILPEHAEEITAFSKKRNPFNHPCIMYKKSKVEEAGGYQDFYLLEDYYLWIRMLQNGCKGYNLQEPLLKMRAGSEMYKRRSGWKYACSQRKLFHYMRTTGWISNASYIRSVTIRCFSSLIPNGLRKFLFESILRK